MERASGGGSCRLGGALQPGESLTRLMGPVAPALFDALGIALALYDAVHVEVVDGPDGTAEIGRAQWIQAVAAGVDPGWNMVLMTAALILVLLGLCRVGRLWRVVYKGAGEPGASATGVPKFAYTDLSKEKPEAVSALRSTGDEPADLAAAMI